MENIDKMQQEGWDTWETQVFQLESPSNYLLINLGDKGMVTISLKDHEKNKSVIIITMVRMIY